VSLLLVSFEDFGVRRSEVGMGVSVVVGGGVRVNGKSPWVGLVQSFGVFISILAI
jgi:hypothetical protein